MLSRAQNLSLFDFIVKNFIKHKKRNDLSFPYSSYTIGIDDKEMIKLKVEEVRSQKILKVKLGQSYNQNIDIINTIRSITSLPMRIDANCAWTMDTFERMISFLEDKNIELIEQPFPPDYPQDFRNEDFIEFVMNNSIPIILDESIVYPSDIKMNSSMCNGVNLKLSKSGGLLKCLKMIEDARRLNMKVMIGCMIESNSGINFAACLSPLADYADLDGNLLIKNDPYVDQGNFKIADGEIKRIKNQPGIGIFDDINFHK